MKVYVCTHNFHNVPVLQHRGCFAKLEDALKYGFIKNPVEGKNESGERIWEDGLDRVTEMEVRTIQDD